jgi:Uma2 family endonuclease
MVAVGLLHEDEHVQLIEGEILEITPQYPPHAATIQLLTRVLMQVFGPDAGVRPQLPLALSDDSEPEPDLAVVAGDARSYLKVHPTTALLLVEVADSSLAFDRRRKGRIYAAAAIPEYWIVNLAERALEVHRRPQGAGAGDLRGRSRAWPHGKGFTPRAARRVPRRRRFAALNRRGQGRQTSQPSEAPPGALSAGRTAPRIKGLPRRALRARAAKNYCVGRRICRKVSVLMSRNIGVRGGRNRGCRNSVSKTYPRFGAV